MTTAAKEPRQQRLSSRTDRAARVAARAEAIPAPHTRHVRVAPDPSAAAFFDVDNTIMQGASLFHFARGLHQRGVFGLGVILKAALAQGQFLLGAEDPDQIEKARSTALAFIRDRRVEEISQLAEEIYDDSMAAKIWPGTRALAQLHLDQGQRVWLVTAAPVEMASVIARRLGLTGAMGTVAEQEDGVYTGRLVGGLLHGEAKAEAIVALAERENLDLGRCWAYSDSFNDVPMLSLVGNPCAINPDRDLRSLAEEHGWRIRDYRAKRRRNVTVVGAVAAGAVAGGSAVAITAAVRRTRSGAA